MIDRRRSRSAKDLVCGKIELTPMIDVTFLILVFFLCTLQFKTLDGKLSAYLPQDQGLSPKPAIPSEKARIIVRTHPDDVTRPVGQRRARIFIAGGRAPVGIALPPPEGATATPRFEPADTLQQVRRYLTNARSTDPGMAAILEASPDVPHVAAVTLLDAIHASGFRDISFAGIPRRLIQDLQTGRIR